MARTNRFTGPNRFTGLKARRSPLFFACLFAVSLIAHVPSSRAQTTASSATSFPAPSAAAVQPIPLVPPSSTEQSSATQTSSNRKKAYDATVTGGDWQATSVQLIAGDDVKFQTSGSMILSDGHTVKPDGVARNWTDLIRIYPLNSANSGALIGRIGSGNAALPFLIGDGDTLTAPVDGQLYLRANLSSNLNANGTYTVKVALQPSKAGDTAASVADSGVFASQLSPALFKDIPRRVTDQAGNLGDMVNFALVGTEAQVKADLDKAAWFPTDANPTAAVVHGLIETLSHASYMAVPMSTLYLFGRPQDMAYARAEAITVVATRNHLRLWKSTETVGGSPLWVGSATHDNGFEKDQRTGGITHHIDPDIDQERDFILASFINAGAAKAAAFVKPSNPVGSARTATGGSFQTDGRIVVILLR
ncbi:MAG: LssY C-terminal domain-containing protein [Acidobacteriaceae bacterium]